MDEEKVKIAIERIKTAREMSIRYMKDELYVMISGGKDSSVIQQLAIESRLNCHFVHSLTTVDAPETVYFVRQEMDRLRALGYDAKIRMPPKSMWQLIEAHYGMPPLRTMRYCCKALKERPIVIEESGKKAFIVTGVRWAESSRRKKRMHYEAIAADPKKAVRVDENELGDAEEIILEEDNTLTRKLFEDCRLRGERVVNPIIDWTDEEVWDFIKSRNLSYNPLYDEGWKRIGCVGCPMQNRKERERQFERWPRYKNAYIAAFDRGLKRAKEAGKNYTWQSGGECLKFMDT